MAKKKKAEKKAKKVTRKKTAKKAAKKRVAGIGISEINIKTVVYGCIGGHCDQKPHRRKLKPGDLVLLTATDPEVTIDFPDGSPFVSEVLHIVLHKGEIRLEVIAEIDVASRTFRCNLHCTECPTLFDPPVMIVEA